MNQTREQWLEAAIIAMRPLFAQHGYTLPENVKAACGFPSKHATSRNRLRIGECWSDAASAGKVFEMFISPLLDKAGDVLSTLAHECVHATVGLKAGHRAPFAKCARAIGLEGKMTATVPGAAFKTWTKGALVKLGDYPHARLRISTAEKTQSTRMLKCECGTCGYTCRVSRKWLEAAGAPNCPVDEEQMEVA